MRNSFSRRPRRKPLSDPAGGASTTHAFQRYQALPRSVPLPSPFDSPTLVPAPTVETLPTHPPWRYAPCLCKRSVDAHYGGPSRGLGQTLPPWIGSVHGRATPTPTPAGAKISKHAPCFAPQRTQTCSMIFTGFPRRQLFLPHEATQVLTLYKNSMVMNFMPSASLRS